MNPSADLIAAALFCLGLAGVMWAAGSRAARLRLRERDLRRDRDRDRLLAISLRGLAIRALSGRTGVMDVVTGLEELANELDPPPEAALEDG